MATAAARIQLCRNYVNGRWVESKTMRIVERRNPANTDEVIARNRLCAGKTQGGTYARTI